MYGDRVQYIKKRIGGTAEKGVYLVEWSNNKIGIVTYHSLKKYEKSKLASFEIRQSMIKMI